MRRRTDEMLVEAAGGQAADERWSRDVRHLPNILSLSRLLATVPLVALILIDRPPAYLVATGLFVLSSITDTLDGRLARRYHLVSRLGVFLDLTADKVFVSAALIALVQVGLVPAWITIVIVAREFLVAGLRSLAAAEGLVIPAGRWGKQKTLLTLLALGGILLGRGLGGATAFPLGLSTGAFPHSFADYLLAVADAVLLLAVVWTILSAVEYLRAGWKVALRPGG
jgi:CDP-diacylglycerol--glycerol-3-phosphate 3-phosphatidyltransferase